ncbi:DUF441 family protein [Actinobacillus succinogenes]|uniref:UPF0756 membrane protein Asuc_1151 n=1 Tax=Actinobacillus succinogenes (strain ATCC 55618 / DSM 22257 / CCUG 43843 / 130Z) TaxID=339671 RepID=Y1151_ACTSZ|nr:DUF441 domain-containing protein [Actinobacillus succinogenes]A6VNG9.1 RecName: Full=UPF0756 membrane protein Asuc_1151 [Actinobacillus succinogenes 130Z]ABR74516.1 protein of unknown function DUF441 [Actinobacillus succinogenes 130Z]PHI41066.1 DUF441 family protein [Actinobacillus succinogenes]
MSLHFNSIGFLLVVLALLGVLGNNSSITISATVLLLMQQTFLSKYIPVMEKYGLNIGVIILTIGVLSPIVAGKVKIPALTELLHWKMFLSLVVGMLVAWLAGRGVSLMGSQPVLLTGLLIGTILGVGLLGGIPVGPLIAAGILSLLLGKV